MDVHTFADKISDGEFYPLDDEYSIPCYGVRFSVENCINTKELILQYMELAKAHAFKDGKSRMTIFSVTQRDKHHKLWLETVKDMPNVYVLKVKSRHADYWCWMIVQIKVR